MLNLGRIFIVLTGSLPIKQELFSHKTFIGALLLINFLNNYFKQNKNIYPRNQNQVHYHQVFTE